MPIWMAQFFFLLLVDSRSFAQTEPAKKSDPKTETEKAPPKEELTPEAQSAVEELRKNLPADSEAIKMLDAILSGSQLSPSEGWFAVAKTQTRFTWDYVRTRYDMDKDGQVSPEEFGAEQEFQIIDKNRDKVLTEVDLEWKPEAKTPPGLLLFMQADEDGNGKVTRAEFEKLFERYDESENGFLALDEAKNRLDLPENRNEPRPDKPSQSTLVMGLKGQEIGSLQAGPKVDEIAPDFTLTSLDGKEVSLWKEIGNQPIVLIFGNFTCGPFRRQAGNIEEFHEKYQGQAKIFLVYVKEAHPNDGWWMLSNQRNGIDIKQPRTLGERVDVATRCRGHLDLKLPMLVDALDDQVGSVYSGMPNRLYVIDREGKVAFKNGRGPFGFSIPECEQALLLLLRESN